MVTGQPHTDLGLGGGGMEKHQGRHSWKVALLSYYLLIKVFLKRLHK